MVKIKKDDNPVKLVTKEMTFAEVLEIFPDAAMIMMAHGMGCLHCGMATAESIQDGCMAHGIDPQEMVDEINKAIQASK